MSSGYISCQQEEDILKMGSHLTWEELKNIEKSILQREKEILKVRCVDYDTLPTYYGSIKNLYGYILYKLEEVSESIEVFNEVLEKDPDNLNATNNLVEIHTKLGRLSGAKTYREKLERIIQQKEESMITRAYCERAHAVRHFQQDCREFTYMPYLRQAIEFGANINTPEKSEWLFGYGQALFRKDFQLMIANASYEENEPNFVEAIHSFYDVIKVEGGSKVYTGLSWVYIGILLRHDGRRSIKRCFPNHPEIHGMTSIDCIETGLRACPENELVTRRVASEFARVGRHEEAAELFHKSLAKEKSWFAYRHQGLMYLWMYEAEHDPEMLLKAEASLKQALEMKNVHADHSDLGYVYFLKGQWEKALALFHCAKENIHNDNFDTTETHRRWAECLEACGEHEGATMQLEMAKDMKKQLQSMIENIEKRDRKHGTNCHGNECKRYHSEYCGYDRKGFVNIKIADTIPYRRCLLNQEYTRKPYSYDFFLSFCHIDHRWAVAFLKKLEQDFNLVGCLRHRDYRLGVSKLDNIITSIEVSYKTIIILSPDSLKDNLCKFEIKRAASENIGRECIIPMMLRPCDIPKEINTLCGLECESGQIHEHDWIRLGKELKQENGLA